MYNREEVLEKLKQIISWKTNYGLKAIKLESHLRDELDVDSLDMVELKMTIETRFNLYIPDSDWYGPIETVEQALNYLEKRLK